MWRFSVGLPLRLTQAAREQIFDAVRAVIAQTGVLRGRLGALGTRWCSRTRWSPRTPPTQLVVAIRRVRREAPEAAEIVAATCHAQDYDDAG